MLRKSSINISGRDYLAFIMKNRKVVIESEKVLFDDFFKIEESRLKYERFDGSMSPAVRRLNFERGDSVAAVIFNKETRKILLTNQFKYPAFTKGDGWITEVLAGTVADGESPEAAMRREIYEEAGHKVAALTHISTFFVSPGGTSERIILYYAEVENSDKIAAGGGLASEDEDIEMLEFSVPEIWEVLEKGEIADAKTIIALMWLRDKLEE